MKKILIIDTTWPINSRTERFKNSFSKYFSVLVSAWNRGADKVANKENTYILNSNIGYGNQLKKILYIPLFFFHTYLICRREKPDTIFASHWDSLFCAVFIKLIWNWKLKIIYDCLDLPTFSNTILKKILILMERLSLKFVNLTIFASRYFKVLYPSDTRSYVFENYPSLELLGMESEIPEWLDNEKQLLLNNKNNVTWIGVVRYLNILDNILLSIQGTDIYFFVFGDGPDLENLKKLVDKYRLNDQVIFFGRYKPSDIRFIYEKSNLVWAAYPTDDYNAVYAISNKYFECSYFEKKIILSRKTKMAEELIGNSDVILVNEYSSTDIKQKLLLNLKNIDTRGYSKYETDISWEEKEHEFIEFVRNNF